MKSKNRLTFWHDANTGLVVDSIYERPFRTCETRAIGMLSLHLHFSGPRSPSKSFQTCSSVFLPSLSIVNVIDRKCRKTEFRKIVCIGISDVALFYRSVHVWLTLFVDRFTVIMSPSETANYGCSFILRLVRSNVFHSQKSYTVPFVQLICLNSHYQFHFKPMRFV